MSQFRSEPFTSFRIFVHEREWKEMAARGIIVPGRTRSPELREALNKAYRCSLYSWQIPPAEITFEAGVLRMRFDDGLNH